MIADALAPTPKLYKARPLTLQCAAGHRESWYRLEGTLIGIFDQCCYIFILCIARNRHACNDATSRDRDVSRDSNAELGLDGTLEKIDLCWTKISDAAAHHQDQRLLASIFLVFLATCSCISRRRSLSFGRGAFA